MSRAEGPERIANRYRLLRKLGEGGMGAVYLVQDTLARTAAKPLALKFLQPTDISPQRLQQFHAEFTLLTRLEHPHLVKVYDFGRDEQRQQYFFTAEFLEGEDLFAATRQQELNGILTHFLQVCDALTYIHHLGILHNDLKPSNILVTEAGVRVLDLGISTLSSETVSHVQGTAGFLAPEVMLDRHYSVASDLFSLGMCFYKVLAGAVPLDRSDHGELLRQILASGVPTLATKRADLPATLIELVDRMVARHPGSRPVSAHEVSQILAALLPAAHRGKLKQGRSWNFSSPLIGRQVALQETLGYLDSFALSATSSESLPVILVKGPEGAGKSRFLQEIAYHLRLKNRFVLEVKAAAGSQPFGPLDEVLVKASTLAGHAIPEPLVAGLLAPQLAAATDGANDAGAELETATDRLPVFFMASEFLREAARRETLTILIDDLECISPDGLDLLSFLLRLRLPNLFWVLAFAPEHEARMKTSLHLGKPFETTLGDLDESELRLLLDHLLGRGHYPGDLAAALTRMTKGRLGQIEQLLRSWIQSAALTRKNEDWQIKPKSLLGGAPPEKDREPPKELEELLEACALFSEPFTARDLAALTELPLPRLAQQLDAATELAFLESATGFLYRWKHEAHRTHRLRKNLATKKTHARFAAYLEGYWSDTPSIDLAERIASHYGQAEKVLDQQAWILRTVRLCIDTRAYRRGEALLRSTPTLGMNQQAQRLLGDLLIAQGRNREAADLFTALLSLGGEPLLAARDALLLAGLKRERGQPDEAQRLAQQGLDLLQAQNEPILRARLLAQKALCVSLQGTGEKSRQLAGELMAEAIQNAPKEKDPERYAHLLCRRASIFLRQGVSLPQVRRDLLDAESIFAKRNHAAGLAIVYQNLSTLYECEHRFSEQEDALQKALHHARSTQDPRRMLFCAKALGTFYLQKTQIGAAQKHFLQAIEWARILEDTPRHAEILFSLTHLYALAGRFAEARTALSRAQELSGNKSPRWLQTLGELASLRLTLQLGDFARAEKMLALVEKSQSPDDPFALACLNYRAELHIVRGDKAAARQDLEALERAYQKIDLVDGLADVSLKLAQLQLICNEELDASLTRGLQDSLTRFQGSHLVHETIQAFLALADLHLRRKEYAPARTLLETLENQQGADLGLFVDLEAQRSFLLGTLLAAQEQADKSWALLSRARSLLESQASALEPEERPFFLNHPQRQKIIQQQASRANPELLALENKQLRRQCELLDRLLTLEEETLGQDATPWQKLLDGFIERLGLTGGAMYTLEKTRLERTAHSRGYGGSHETQVLEDCLAQDRSRIDGHTILLPLFWKQHSSRQKRAESLPLGILLLESPDAALLGLLEEHGRSISGLFGRVRRTLELQKHVDTTSRELLTFQTAVLTHTHELQLRYSYATLHGTRSPAMIDVLQILERIIPSSIPVLIQGESGTGKELVARTIHFQGPLATKPFVPINCATLERNLAESALFGHVKGAFTGATDDRPGLLTQADGGTVFLDEVGDLPLDVQTKLLRAIQEREIRPVGGAEVQKITFRVIAATHRDLEAMIEEGTFRRDLYYRLCGITVRLPALRERREDIPILIEHFLKETAEREKKPPKKLTGKARKALVYYAWPGNVRQLRHTLEMLTILGAGKILDVDELPPEILGLGESASQIQSLQEAKAEFMKQYLQRLLQSTGGNISEAARRAGIRREYIHTLLKGQKR